MGLQPGSPGVAGWGEGRGGSVSGGAAIAAHPRTMARVAVAPFYGIVLLATFEKVLSLPVALTAVATKKYVPGTRFSTT